MATPAHKGAIAFGMVYIPVQLYRTTKDYDISFNQLCKDTKERVKYKKICAGCKKEVSSDDIVKGYQYEKDKYVIMTNEEIEAIKTKKDKTIQIVQFTQLDEIDAIFYEKNYYAYPEPGGEKAYQLLRAALEEEGKVAIARTVLGTKENLMALCPEENGLLVKTLFFADEVVDPPKAINEVKIAKEEKDMAKLLINSMTKPFNPDAYQDEYQARLRDAIANKINGQEIVVPREENQNVVVDLMEALQRSLSMNEAKSGATKTTKASAKTKNSSKKVVSEKEPADETKPTKQKKAEGKETTAETRKTSKKSSKASTTRKRTKQESPLA